MASKIVSLLAMDMIIYWQHRLFHTIPVLWALHKTHHSDQDIDVTTGARFHPIEIWLSMVIKIATVVILGVPPVAVIAFEIILNARLCLITVICAFLMQLILGFVNSWLLLTCTAFITLQFELKPIQIMGFVLRYGIACSVPTSSNQNWGI